MFKPLGRVVLLAIAVTVAACSVQLVAPYDSQLMQQASAMQAEVSAWDLAMRQGAGTVADDPRNPEVMATLNTWRGQADALLTLAVSSDPHTVNCSKAAAAVYAGMESMIPANLRAAAAPPNETPSAAASSSSCEVELVADLQSGLDDITRALKWCRVSWVPDDYFAIANGSGAGAPPAAPSPEVQDRLTKSCLAEFKAPAAGPGGAQGMGHGRAVSHLLTTLEAIVYVENRKQAAAEQ